MTALFVVLILAAAVLGGPAVRADRTVGDLRVEMTVAKATFQPAEPIGIAMRVTNVSAGPIMVTTGGQSYDVFVRQRGALVWQWSHDKAFTQAVRYAEMPPGDARSYQTSWDQRDLQGRPVDPGTYEVSCVVMTGQRSGPSSVEVGPIRITIAR
jgi:hypothetical protein